MVAHVTWSYPTQIRFGVGRIKELAAACKSAGISRPLFVTDAGLATLPVTAAARAVLDDAGVQHGLFTEVKPNPTDKNLEAGVAAFKAGAHDGVIAFGGGSALDLAKLIAFMPAHDRPGWDFEDIGD